MDVIKLRDTVKPVCAETFAEEVQALRKRNQELEDKSNITRFCGRRLKNVTLDKVEDSEFHVFWYADGTDKGQCIRIAHFPGSLAGEILGLRQPIPPLNGDHEIIKNEIIPVEGGCPSLRLTETKDELEDHTGLFEQLPIVDVDFSIHTLKHEVYRSEIVDHLTCQGGSCPGTPISPHIAQLLGRTQRGDLVFEAVRPGFFKSFYQIEDFKRWLLQLICGLKSLHSVGIVHRSLCTNTLFMRFAETGPELVIGGLGSQNANVDAPEIPLQQPSLGDYTKETDIYDIGEVIKDLIYGGSPVTKVAPREVPSPLQSIVEACQHPVPESRPDLASLQLMVENIKVNKVDAEDNKGILVSSE